MTFPQSRATRAALAARLLEPVFGRLDVALGEDAESFQLSHADLTLVGIARSGASAAVVEEAAARVRALTATTTARRRAVPFVFVARMGDAGRAACARHGVGHLDACGNARLETKACFVHVQGRRGVPRSRGRPRDLFAPRSARVVRELMLHPAWRTQKELAASAQVDRGHVSRVLAELVSQGFAREAGAIPRITEGLALLDSLRERRTSVDAMEVRLRVHARSAEAALRAMAETLESESIAHAATGTVAAHALAGAPLQAPMRVYVARIPTDASLALAGFERADTGGDLTLVVDPDLAIEHARWRNLSHVDAVTAYVDLDMEDRGARDAARRLLAGPLAHLRRADETEPPRGSARRAETNLGGRNRARSVFPAEDQDRPRR